MVKSDQRVNKTAPYCHKTLRSSAIEIRLLVLKSWGGKLTIALKWRPKETQ